MAAALPPYLVRADAPVPAAALLAAAVAFEDVCKNNTVAFARRSQPSTDACTATQPGTGAPRAEPLTRFQSKALPSLTLHDLIVALSRNTRCDDRLLLAAVLLAARYCTRTGDAPTLHTMHRLYVAALHVAMKANSDYFFTCAAFAKLAGVSALELSRLEAELLCGTDWDVVVSAQALANFVASPAAALEPLRLCEVSRPDTPETGLLPAAKSCAATAAAWLSRTALGSLDSLPASAGFSSQATSAYACSSAASDVSPAASWRERSPSSTPMATGRTEASAAT